MSEPDTELARFLSRLPLFRSFSVEARDELLQASTTLQLESGALLYEQESPPDHLYLIISGRVSAEHYNQGELSVHREIGRGEAVGGMSILSTRPHKARVRAIRDTRILQIPAAAFLALFDSEPATGRRIVQRWLNRFMDGGSEAQVRRSIGSLRTVAVLAGHAGAPVEAVARGLSAAFSKLNLSLRLDRGTAESLSGMRIDGERGQGSSALSYWLNEQEQRHRYLVLQADEGVSEWTSRCLRQADRVLVVVDAAASVQPGAITRRVSSAELNTVVEVVVVGQKNTQPMAWRDIAGAETHHLLRQCNDAEFDRLARMLSGRAVGIALGGGGARGFAHIGLISAMEQLGIPIDLVYGTSMGAFIGGLLACGRDPEAIREICLETWVRRNLLNDYTVPRVSLIRARKARGYMERLFDGARIEDLAIPYACISTNLNKGVPMVHDHGLLAHWIGTSMSVPGIAPPVVYRGDLLVDGGLVASVPSDALVDRARGPVIASDVTSEEVFRGVDAFSDEPEQMPKPTPRRSPNDTNIFQILYRTATLSTPNAFVRRMERVDCYLRMPVSGIGMFQWEKAEDVINGSREYAIRKLESWLASDAHQNAHPDLGR